MPVEVIGFAWYRREDYDRLKAMFKDGEKLPDTYEDWLAKAQNTVLNLADRFLIEKSYIDPETFPMWCAKRGLQMDAIARTRYSAEVAQARFDARKRRKLSI